MDIKWLLVEFGWLLMDGRFWIDIEWVFDGFWLGFDEFWMDFEWLFD